MSNPYQNFERPRRHNFSGLAAGAGVILLGIFFGRKWIGERLGLSNAADDLSGQGDAYDTEDPRH